MLVQKSGKHLHKFKAQIPSKDYIKEKGLDAFITNFFNEFDWGLIKPFFKT